MNTFTKLSDGSWGIKTTDRHLQSGDVAVVTRRDGSTKTVTVTEAVSTGRSGGVYRVSSAPVPTSSAPANLQQQSRAGAAGAENVLKLDWPEPWHEAVEREWWEAHPNGTEEQYDAFLCGRRA